MILSIDQGTTGTTILIVNRHGRVVSQAYAELPQHFPKPGWVEHKPDEILRVTYSVIKRALGKGNIRPSRIQAIGITNQRETAIIWSRRTGRPVANAIVWQCRRTAQMCQSLSARGYDKIVRKRTGLVLDAYFSGTKVRWLFDNVRGLRDKAKRSEIAFGTVDSWLIWNLTGGKTHATDTTNASRTLMYNIRQMKWDPKLLQMLGIPASILPDVKAPSSYFGETASYGPLPAGIPILGVAGDQQASMVGHACLSKASAKNTYGTGCFLLLNTGGRCVNSKNGLVSTLVYGGSNKPTYALEGSVFIAGAAVQWLRDGLGIIKSAPETEKLALSVKDTGGVYVVPAFVGLGAPYWDMNARGLVCGITRGTSRAVLVRATLESLAYQTRDIVEAMQKDSGIRFSKLDVDGGAAQNNWLMQFQSDILGIPVVRPAMVANTGRGAALLAGIELGWWKASDFSKLGQGKSRVFKPKLSDKKRRFFYDGWKEAVSRSRTSGK